MAAWKPITEDEFSQLFDEHYNTLDHKEKHLFDRYWVRPWRAVIRRSKDAGDEPVFVAAQTASGVLYFDDVEGGFNISAVDEDGRILAPGGSRNSLKEAVAEWFTPQQSS